MHNIFIATSTFAVHSKSVKYFEASASKVVYNPLSRKLTSNQLIKYECDSTGIIAGTEL